MIMRYQEIKEQLIQKISQLESGTRLPSRPTLCNQLDTNRTTLDRAIKELEGDGLVKRREYLEVPVRVEYEITEPCRRLIPILDQLGDWSMTL